MTRFVLVLLAMLSSSLALAQEVPLAVEPTAVPTTEPAATATEAPTEPPTAPGATPEVAPTTEAAAAATEAPTEPPTAPGATPEVAPTTLPAAEPPVTPTVAPVVLPDPTPAAAPAAEPADAPLAAPAVEPVGQPAASVVVEPTIAPAVIPAVGPRVLPYAGRWEGDFNAAFSLSAGNNDSASLNLGTDIVYQAPDDKLSLYGQYIESRARTVTNGVVSSSVTALQWRLGTRYDSNLTDKEFGFVGLDLSHDRIQQLVLRGVVSVGLGHHLDKSAERQWDVYAGVTDRTDWYEEAGVLINDVRLSRLHTIETLFGEDSSHRLTETTRFKQKLVIYPSLGNDKGTRATLDAGLQVDVNKSLSLSVKLQGRYDSLAQAPAERYDLLLLTGLSFRFKE